MIRLSIDRGFFGLPDEGPEDESKDNEKIKSTLPYRGIETSGHSPPVYMEEKEE